MDAFILPGPEVDLSKVFYLDRASALLARFAVPLDELHTRLVAALPA